MYPTHYNSAAFVHVYLNLGCHWEIKKALHFCANSGVRRICRNFTVTFQRSKSHASDHSSLSDEEDSSDTGIQVSTPSGGDSQGSSHEEDSDSQDEYEEDWTAIQQEDANSSDSASQTNISNKQPRIPRAPAPQVQRESKTPHQDQSRSRTVRTRRIRKPAVSLSTESVEDSYEDGWGGESLHRTRQPYSHWATSSSVPASAQYPLGYNTYQAQGVPGGQLALRMSNANSPYAYSPYQQQNVPTYYQHNAHMGSLHQPTSYAQPAGYFPYPAQYQVGPMPQYYPPPVIYSPPPPAPAPSQTPPAAPAPAPAPAPTTAPAQVVPVTSPAPAAATPDPNNEKFDQLRQLILDQKAEQEAKEAAAKKAEEDRKAAEAAAKKIADDLAAAKKEAAAKATTEAEKKAAEAAAKKEAEAAAKAKKEAESKAKTEADAAAAAAAAAAAKPPPPPPEKKKPIKFKDAVGRKFSFPFHLCNTWEVFICPQKLFGRYCRH